MKLRFPRGGLISDQDRNAEDRKRKIDGIHRYRLLQIGKRNFFRRGKEVDLSVYESI